MGLSLFFISIYYYYYDVTKIMKHGQIATGTFSIIIRPG